MLFRSNDHGAMPVGMHDVVRAHRHAEHVHLAGDLGQVHPGVAGADLAAQQLEPRRAGVEVAERAVRRDIIAMGARPVAVVDPLRFGAADHPDTKRVLPGVVAGIGGYGNCVGVPTVAGETNFHRGYDGNILVNAMCVGLADAGERVVSVRLLAYVFDGQAGDGDRREKERQKPLAGASEGDDFALGRVEGLSPARVPAIADLQSVTSRLDWRLDRVVHFERPDTLTVNLDIVGATTDLHSN